jgi:uncharacterized protein (DUF58 family)
VLGRNGWLLLAVAAALVFVGRLFGIVELYVAGAGAALLVLGAFIYVRTARVRLRVSRSVTPSRVHAGDTTRVEVGAVNKGTWRTPVVRLRDPVGGTRGALLNLAPLRPGETARAAYRLPTARRGIVSVGPLSLEVADPFGIAARTAVAAPLLELTVYPKVDRVLAPPGVGDRNPHGVAAHHNALGRQGDDFYALRQYVVGDDLRRVHWKSTARSDDLMVRQDEVPWQDRTTVVLDIRRAAHDAASLERAVSAAASVLSASARAGHLLRFMASDGTDSGTLSGVAQVESLMEYLARVEASGVGTLRAVFDDLLRAGNGGALVVVLGRATGAELETLARLRRRYRHVQPVIAHPPIPPLPAVASALRVIDATADDRFAQSWASMVGPERSEVSV